MSYGSRAIGLPPGLGRAVRRRLVYHPLKRKPRPRWAKFAAVLATVAFVAGACGGHGKTSVGVNLSVFHLKVGDCLVPPTNVQAELSTIKVVSCKEPHTQEVFALVDDSGAGDNYPTDTALRTFADGNCLQDYAGYCRCGLPKFVVVLYIFAPICPQLGGKRSHGRLRNHDDRTTAHVVGKGFAALGRQRRSDGRASCTYGSFGAM